MKKNILFSVILLGLISIISINFVSAYNGYSSLSDYLDNEWVVFTLIFLLLFTVIYFSVYKTTQNQAVSGIIGAALGLLISVSVLKKGMISGFFGDTLTNMMGFIGIIIAIFITFSLFIYYMGFLWGFFGGLITITGFLVFVNFEQFNPSGFNVSPVSTFLFLLEDLGSLAGTILIVSGIVLLFWKHKTRVRQGMRYAGAGISKIKVILFVFIIATIIYALVKNSSSGNTLVYIIGGAFIVIWIISKIFSKKERMQALGKQYGKWKMNKLPGKAYKESAGTFWKKQYNNKPKLITYNKPKLLRR